jgi:hypothetical protein
MYIIIILANLLGIFLFSFIHYFRKYKQIKEEYDSFNQINIGDYVSCEMSLKNNSFNNKTTFTLYYSGKVTHLNIEDKSIKIKYDSFYTIDLNHMQWKSDFPHFMEQWIPKNRYEKIYKNDPRSEKLKGILKSI